MLAGNLRLSLCWKGRRYIDFMNAGRTEQWLMKGRNRLIEYIGSKDGVEWVKMEDICDDFKRKNQPVKGALLPAEHGAILKNPGKSKTKDSQ